MKHVEVVAAVIINENNKILCTQRLDNKYDYLSRKYEFPGGKVEQNETNEAALIREIKEELNIDITIKNHFLTVEHQYPDFKLTMHSYTCTSQQENVTLLEHIDALWLGKEQLEGLDWAAADIPIVQKLISQ